MRYSGKTPFFFLRAVGRRRLASILLLVLLTGALVALIGVMAGADPSLAQGAAPGQPALGFLAPASPITGTFQVMLPLVHREWRPAAPQIVYFVAEPVSIGAEQSTALSWGVNNEVFGLTLMPGFTDVTGKTSVVVSPTQTTLYTLYAYNPLGSVHASTTVTVLPPPVIEDFTAQPAAIEVGGSSHLMWQVSGSVTSLTLEPGIGEVTGQTGVWVSPGRTTVYTLTARNAAGSTTAQETVTVNPPTIYLFYANPATVNPGQGTTLNWTVGGAVDSLTIEPGVGEVTGQSSVQVWPTQTTVYTLTAANSAGSSAEQTTVTVAAPPVIVSFTVAPASINLGESSTLSWVVSGPVTSLSLAPGIGDVTGLDSVQVTPGQTTEYTLTAANSFGSDTAQATVTVGGTVDDWWDNRWRARLLIEAQGSGYERFDKVVETAINFTAKLGDAGLSGAFDDAHLRVIEIDADNQVLNAQVPFQFDHAAGYDASSNAAGTLVILMEGQTGSAQTRRFHAYFDTTDNQNGKTPASVPARVSFQDNVNWQGQSSFQITAQNAVYYYHKQGAGFASMFDGEGRDWISYNTKNGPAGNNRGVPNLATAVSGENTGVFHPGYTLSTSTILHSGPIKLTIRSVTNDDKWEKTWAIYPHYATMTLVRKPAANLYWILYEGTPGGAIDGGDFYYLPDGVRHGVYTEIDRDLAGEEWIYFGDDARNQVLYAINHQQDTAIDCHYVLQDAMTVFGFGRDRNSHNSKFLNALPGYFTFGFTAKTDHQAVSRRIRSAYQPVTVTVGAGEPR